MDRSDDLDLLRDDQWERIEDLIPGGRKGKRGPRSDNRGFIDALVMDDALGHELARPAGALRRLPKGQAALL